MSMAIIAPTEKSTIVRSFAADRAALTVDAAIRQPTRQSVTRPDTRAGTRRSAAAAPASRRGMGARTRLDRILVPVFGAVAFGYAAAVIVRIVMAYGLWG